MTESPAPRLHRFTHQAMRTEWEFLIVHEDASTAEGAAHCAFRDVDQLEEELSRFRAYSDISRIGYLRAGEELSVGLAAWDCLSLARDVWEETGGAFDAAIGPLYELWRNRPAAEPPTPEDLEAARARSGMNRLELIPRQRVRVHADQMRLDLGAIGKGYALDMAAHLLREDWEISNALLITGGGSTILAMGGGPEGTGWLINAGPPGSAPVPLADSAVSASGFLFQGVHIINPRTGLPVSTAKVRTWAIAPSAALSDALSTAFLVMSQGEIDAFCRRHPDVRAIVAAP